MALLKLPDSGQETELPDDIARDDNRLKEALAIFLPGAANIEIKREETSTGQLVVSIIKKAGSKGADPTGPDSGPGSNTRLWQAVLEAAPQEHNPALLMLYQIKEYERAGQLTFEFMLGMQPRIQQAIGAGQAETSTLDRVMRNLKAAQPTVSRDVPQGF